MNGMPDETAAEAMSRWTRRDFIKTGAAAGIAASFSGLAGRVLAAGEGGGGAGSRPNIVFILSDDFGIDGVGCYGSDRFNGATPHLDALAAGGVRFERCYSTPLCGPSRCEIMTGRYPFRTGGLTNATASRPRPRDEVSIARILRQAGYATCQAGKWRQMCATPADWGFEEYITDPTAGGYFWEKTCTKNGEAMRIPEGQYYPDVAHHFAMNFIERNRHRPFFLYYSSHLVHEPILRTPATKPGTKGAKELYDDNVAYLDQQVGKIVAELNRLGLREKTLIVFSGDNGTAGRSGTIGGRPVHGQKGSMLEGGVRVPLIANWKGTAPAGTVLDDLVDFSDIYPTFAELAGAALPAGVTLDGRSFAPRLQGHAGRPREWVFVQLGTRWYVRNDRWKLTQSGELFDMKNAPFVEAPVTADAEDEAAKAARKRLQTVLAALNPASGKVITPDEEAAERARHRKQREKQKRKAAKQE